MLGLIKRTCKGLHDPKTLCALHCSLVCSNLEYCSVVWSHIQKEILISWREYREERLKSDDPYEIRLKKLNLMSLEKRRSLTDVTFLYKVLNHNITIDIS